MMDDNKLKDTLAYLFAFHSRGANRPGPKQAGHVGAASAYLEAWTVLFNTETPEEALGEITVREVPEEFRLQLVSEMEIRLANVERLYANVQAGH